MLCVNRSAGKGASTDTQSSTESVLKSPLWDRILVAAEARVLDSRFLGYAHAIADISDSTLVTLST